MKPKTKETGARSVPSQPTMGENIDYSAWSQEKLIERVTALERELKSKNESTLTSSATSKRLFKKHRSDRAVDPSKYDTRLVAFKVAYLGKNYKGYEYSPDVNPLTTIEEELWKALSKARLIFPKINKPPHGEINWEGTEYSKCGRTDKGVSAFGQVIGIRVRSAKPLQKRRNIETQGDMKRTADKDNPPDNGVEISNPHHSTSVENEEEDIVLDDSESSEEPEFDPINDELPYCTILNKQLPPDIRILAWCPSPPADFNARFNCQERQYKYFFTNPCFPPMPDNLEPKFSLPGAMKDGWLDIEAMREAAKLLEGLHDFRNFCKVDAGKQITNFERTIYHASITEHVERRSGAEYVREAGFHPKEKETEHDSKHPRVYTFNLHGSAFLWHQVRHIVAILFAVGQGLEKPSVVSELLDVDTNPRRPLYEMATETPLVLWNCVFRDDDIQWYYVGDGPEKGNAKYGTDGLMENLWKVWHERKLDEVLAASLLDQVYCSGSPVEDLSTGRTKPGKSQKVFDGGDVPRLQGKYIPVMKKQLSVDPSVTNEKYAIKKGFKGTEDMKIQMYKKRNGIVDEEAVE